jgi:hypothetical protein
VPFVLGRMGFFLERCVMMQSHVARVQHDL